MGYIIPYFNLEQKYIHLFYFEYRVKDLELVCKLEKE